MTETQSVRLVDIDHSSPADLVERLVREGCAIRMVYVSGNPVVDGAYLDLCNAIWTLYEALDVHSVKLTSQSIGPLVVLVLDPTNGRSVLWGESLLGRAFRLWMEY